MKSENQVSQATEANQPQAYPNQEKKLTKQQKKEQEYWKSMIPRYEAYKMAEALAKEQCAQVAMASTLAITALREILVRKGICTHEDIEEISKEMMEKLANQQAVQNGEEPVSGTEATENQETK